MSKLLFALMVLVLLLAACGAPAAPTAVPAVPTATTAPAAPPTLPSPTLAPTVAPTAVPTIVPTAAPTSVPTVASATLRADQLKKLQALLQNKDFALEIASWLDAAYYKGQGQTPPPFLKPEEETQMADASVKEEKIAINLAGFYAVETAVGLISERTKETPLDIIDSIAKGTRPKDDLILVARFANATWKAGQPFRALSRITRDNFIPAVLLSDADVQKDIDQIKAASQKLSEAMQDVRGKSNADQLKKLQTLLQSKDFALEMATWLDAAYYKGQGQTPPPFLKPEEETAVTQKSVKEQKIAINLAGFYALETGVGVISERTKETPLDIIDGIAKGTRSKDDMTTLSRLANATWKAGQPFRALSRISRDNFIPAVLLTDADVQKDLDQIKAAAQKVSEAMPR